MNPDTGEIRHFKADREAKKAGFTVPVEPAQEEVLLPLTPAQRLEKARELKLIPPLKRDQQRIGGKVYKVRKSKSR